MVFLMLGSWASYSATPASAALPPLGQWNIAKDSVTISGVSSGGFMAVQMGIAFSDKISAVASVAGGIYWCSQGDQKRAKEVCMGDASSIDPAVQIAKTQQLASNREIAPLENLRRQKIYIYASPKDKVIDPLNSEKLKEFYNAFVPSSQIGFEQGIESAHGFPTLGSGIPCGFAYLPWILKCNFDLAGAILSSAYGTLQPRGVAQTMNLIKFSQSAFGDQSTPLYEEGWVYVPQECAQGEACRLHVALHGCQMNPDFIQDKFVTLAGYNDWAETNRIIVLYPQSAKLAGDNPYACWDWYGFTGASYMTKQGVQMKALSQMIEHILQ